MVTVAKASNASDTLLVPVVAGWWVAAALIGMWRGRGGRVSASIARLLAQARAATSLPDQRAGLVMINRLWPLLISTLGAAAVGVIFPQVSGIAGGFAILWAMDWRHQDKAVAAIEERDGVSFFVERTSPLRPIQLVRTPGFRRDLAPPRAAA